MLRIVKQTVVLPATPKALYAMYLSPRAHGAITGGKIRIGARGAMRSSARHGAGPASAT